jgi:hypothetical protein
MKKVVFSLLFSVVLLFCNAQVKKHAGHYTGFKGDDLYTISIIMDLNKDSTYKIVLKYSFLDNKICGFGQKEYTGKWLEKGGWIFFKPVSTEHQFLFTDIWNKPEKHQHQMWKKGYQHALKLTKNKGEDTRIWFHISDDCFENKWDKNSVVKQF